jgi:hypothetical protein
MSYFLSMTLRLSGQVMAAASVLVPAAGVPAAPDSHPWYPQGYRQWTVARFKFVSPGSPNYESRGGFRHHHANDIALGSWGKFSDGAASPGITPDQAKARCFDACHKAQEARDFVSSDPRR